MSCIHQNSLLIEDNPHDVLYFRSSWRKATLGQPLIVLEHGDAAIKHLQNHTNSRTRNPDPLPSLIFLDLNLPGTSGFEVLAWMRQQPKLLKIPVVVLTGSSHTLDIYRAYELGADSYLVKPVTLPALQSMADSLKLPWLAPRNTRPTAAPADLIHAS
jgi:CheY-like chemotaxis protein